MSVEQLQAMSRGLERVTRRLATVEALVRQLAADVTARPAPAEQADEAGRVRSWLLADAPERAVSDLDDLVDWLQRVYLRYPRAQLPSCWLWHPSIVEELFWLRCAHRAAYAERDGTWAKVGDWHDRQRPGVVKRIREAAGSCELSLHAEGEELARPPAAVPLAAAAPDMAHDWITNGRHGTPPTPGLHLIHEAEQHDKAQHRTNHQ